MIKYKINIKDALDRTGFGVYDARKTGYIAQDTLRKLMREETGVTLEAINRLCVILDMDIKDIITFEMDPAEEERRKDIMQQTASKKNRGWSRRRTAAGSPVTAAGQQPDPQ